VTLPLQSVTVSAEGVWLAVLALGVVVGSLVAYQAFRGYRRNDSRPMLFLAVGLALLGPVHFLLSLAPLSAAAVGVALQTVDVLGLLAVGYSLTRA
jgi:hypothetical protein